jgi:hypothetical protein
VGENTSAVRFHNITGYCQTKSKAIVSTGLNWSASKTIEDAWQKILANTATRIGDRDLRIILSLRATEFDTTTGWCELDGIRQKIRKYLLQPNLVTNDRIFEGVYNRLQVDTLRLRLWRHRLDGCFNDWTENDRLRTKGQSANVETGEVCELADHFHLSFGVALDDLDSVC